MLVVVGGQMYGFILNTLQLKFKPKKDLRSEPWYLGIFPMSEKINILASEV
jgi:hypothetical protein